MTGPAWSDDAGCLTAARVDGGVLTLTDPTWGRRNIPLAAAIPDLVLLHARGAAVGPLAEVAAFAAAAVHAVAGERIRWCPRTGAWRAQPDADPRVDALVDAFVTGSPGAARGTAQVTIGVDDAGRPTLSVAAQRRADPAVLAALRRAAAAWPAAGALLEGTDGTVRLDDDELAALLDGALPAVEAAGVAVGWGADIARPRARAALHAAAGADGARTGAVVGWELDVDGTAITAEELEALAAANRPLVRLRGRWTARDADAVRKARAAPATSVPAGAALAAALTGAVEVDGRDVELAPGPAAERLRSSLAAVPALAAPDGLEVTLRGYQLDAVNWLVRNASLGVGACLADDMGLGKTITVIALHLHRAALGPALVVCPASVLGTWEREIRRAAPLVRVRRHHGAGRSTPQADAGFVLTTYATLRADADAFAATDWDLVIADEAQNIKNPRTSAARALRAVPGRALVALTGTPVENRLDDLWSILSWTTPGLLGSRAAFRRRYATPIAAADETAAERLTRLIGPFVLRRRKSDPGIAPELPPKTHHDVTVALTSEQAGLYQALVDESHDAIASADTDMARRGAVVRLLTGLKQICNHPAQYLGQTSGRLAGRSGKLDALDDLLGVALSDGASALVFTQYVAMGRLLLTHLHRQGRRARLLHGGTAVGMREAMVTDFQQGAFPVLVLSLHAAGTGLTLTRAEHVVHYDRWWNPAVEDQATDRAYRIGQSRPVQVHRLICEGTLEERIAAMLADKRSLAASVLDDATGGKQALTELNDAALRRLVALDQP